MTWWYCSTPRMSIAVKVVNDRIAYTPPIAEKFVGQPAKSLGAWLREQGDVTFKKLEELPYVYVWGNNEKRATLKGRPCRVVARGTTMRSVMVEFENGQREIVSYRALREGVSP